MQVKTHVLQRRVNVEETGLEIKITKLVDVVYGQAHSRGAHILIVYRGEVESGELQPADDVDRVEFFNKNELPELAFPSAEQILQKLGVAKISDLSIFS